MEHDRIATLLSTTPPGIAGGRPDAETVVRRFRRRRARRLAATAVVGGLAVLGLVVPLSLLAHVDRGHGPGPTPIPAASGSELTPSGPSATPAGAIPDLGVFRCTPGGVETDTPEFAVQPDGVHLQVGNPGESSALVLRATEPPLSRLPIDILGSDGVEFVTPFLEPGTYEAACEPSSAPDGATPVAEGSAVTVDIVDPTGIWSVIAVQCADTTERVILVGAGVQDREGVPALIRRGVNGVQDGDVIVPAGYPASDEDIAYVVQRDSRNVAVVRALGRSQPLAEALDVTSCDGSGIGDGQGGR